jgi:hypothetical protein
MRTSYPRLGSWGSIASASGQLALAYVAATRFQVFANVSTHYLNAYAGSACRKSS